MSLHSTFFSFVLLDRHFASHSQHNISRKKHFDFGSNDAETNKTKMTEAKKKNAQRAHT